MKLSHVALAGAAVGLCFSIYVTFTGHGSLPAGDTATSARVETSAFQIPAHEEAGALSTMASDSETASRTDREIAALRKELAHLRAEFAVLRQRMQALAALQQQMRAQAGTDGEEEDPDKNLRSDPVARAEAERRHQEQMQVVETAFRREPADPQWSLQATTVLQEALANTEGGQTAMQNVECRSHTCRVEIADDNTGSLAKSLPLLAQQVAQALPSITVNQVEDGNGGTTTILYLSRDPDEPPYDQPFIR